MFFLSKFISFLVIMTPFFVLTMFISMTIGWEAAAKRRLALRVGAALAAISLVLLFGGNVIFEALGITLDSFRIGGGAMLFLSAIGLVNSNVLDKKDDNGKDTKMMKDARDISKIAVVPLAIPMTIGPATIAVLLIQSAELTSLPMLHLLQLPIALVASIVVLTVILLISTWIEEKLGRNVIIVMSKLTGLILAAMASQMIFTGIKGFWTDL